ncbi:hypothetical protein ACOMHN_038139 [Nucella lapillus]
MLGVNVTNSFLSPLMVLRVPWFRSPLLAAVVKAMLADLEWKGYVMRMEWGLRMKFRRGGGVWMKRECGWKGGEGTSGLGVQPVADRWLPGRSSHQEAACSLFCWTD